MTTNTTTMLTQNTTKLRQLVQMNKKLYIVEVSYQAYVLADDFEAAEDFADEIVRTEDYYQVNATLADRNALGWARQSLVYHGGEGDVALGDVLPLPSGEVE